MLSLLHWEQSDDQMVLFLQGDASALEIAAAEMASAAALLVQMEREIVEITQSGVSCTVLSLVAALCRNK